MLGVGLAANVFQLIIYRLIGGIGGTLWSLSRHAYMTDVIPRGERGGSIALFGGINRIGVFGGQAIAIFLGTSLRTPFFVYFGRRVDIYSLYTLCFGNQKFLCSHSGLNVKRLPRLLKTNNWSLVRAVLPKSAFNTPSRKGVVIPCMPVVCRIRRARQTNRHDFLQVDMSLFPLADFSWTFW